MKIRRAKRGDLKVIAEIFKKESNDVYGTKYDSISALKQIKECFGSELFVAAFEKEIIAFVAAYITSSDKKQVYIDELWVKADFQGKGVGRLLMDFLEKFYKKRGIERIRLVARRSAGAYKFYKKLNYKDYKDLIFMEKKI